MIVPNLMFRDIARSDRFCRDTIGMTLTMTVSPAREVGWSGDIHGGSLAMLEWDDSQIMLKTVASFTEDLGVFRLHHTPVPSGTIYFQCLRPAPRHPAGLRRPRGYHQGTPTELVRHD